MFLMRTRKYEWCIDISFVFSYTCTTHHTGIAIPRCSQMQEEDFQYKEFVEKHIETLLIHAAYGVNKWG